MYESQINVIKREKKKKIVVAFLTTKYHFTRKGFGQSIDSS